MATKRRILLDHRGDTALAALMIDGVLQDLLASSSEPGLKVSEIWSARVDKPASRAAGGGFFLDLGEERAFLPRGDGLSSGDVIKVEIQRLREDGKAAAATQKLSYAGAHLVHTPSAPGVNISRKITDPAERQRLQATLSGLEEAGGFVVRTSARNAAQDVLRAEAHALIDAAMAVSAQASLPPRRLRAAPTLAEQAAQLWPSADLVSAPERPEEERPLARYGVSEALAALVSPHAALDGPGLSGAWMAMERSAAVVAIDINTGASRNAEAVNIAALSEIPRQLRLRGWGGQIVVDLAAAGAQDARARERALSTLKKAADAPLEVLGYGPLGLLEARRRRDKAPIETLLRRDQLQISHERLSPAKE